MYRNNSAEAKKEPVSSSVTGAVKVFSPQELIFREGERINKIFVILDGEVEIMQKGKPIRVLKYGDIFGLESFFLNNKTATTSARAVSKARVAMYPVTLIKDIIYNRPQLTEKIFYSLVSQLEQTTQVAVENIPDEYAVELNDVVYEDGEVIIEEGTTGKEFYQLISTEKWLSVRKAGKEIAKISTPGEYFGELSSILGTPRTASVVSVGRSVCRVYSGENIDEILEKYPRVAKRIVKTLAKRIAELNEKIAKGEI